MKLRKAFVCVLVSCLLFSMFSFVSAQETSKEQVTMGYLGVTDEPVVPSLKFEDRKDSFWFNTSNYCIEFFKGNQGYDVLYDTNGNVQIYDVRLTLEHLDKSSWKQCGVPTSVSVQEIDKTSYKITRYYTDYISTSWRVEYIIKSLKLTKFTMILDSGQTNAYRLLWSLDGVVKTNFNEKASSVTFESTTKTFQSTDVAEPSVIIDWVDVKNSLGSITTSVISDVAQGKKLDVTFSLGEIKEGERFELDPTLGYTTAGPTSGGFLSGKKRANLLTTPATDVEVTGVSWYVAWSSGTGNLKCAIFADDNGPTTLIAQTELTMADTTAQWWNFTFASNPALNASTSYWLACAGDTYGNGGNNFNFYYLDGTGVNYTICSISDTDWVNVYRDPWTPVPDGFADRSISLYLTYSEMASYTWTLQARDKDSTNLPRQVTFSGNYGNGTAFSATSDTSGLATITGVEAGNHTVYATWQGHNSANSTVDFSANTTSTIDTRIARLNSSDNYALVSLNTVDLPTPSLSGDSDIFLHDVSASGSLGIVIDHANWRVTVQPSSFEAGGGQYAVGDGTWSWSNSVFSITHDYSETQDILLTFSSDESSSSSSTTTTEPTPTPSPYGDNGDSGNYELPKLTEDDYTNLAIAIIIIGGGFIAALIIVNRKPSRKKPRKTKSELGRHKQPRKPLLRG